MYRKHDIKAIVNIYISILSSQENKLEEKKRMLKEKEKEAKVQESILALLTKSNDSEIAEAYLNERRTNNSIPKINIKNSNKSITRTQEKGGRSVEKSISKIKQVNRQKSVPLPLPRKNDSNKNFNKQFKENKETNSNSIHQIEDSLLDKLEQNIPAMSCIQNDRLITDSIQLPNSINDNYKINNNQQKTNQIINKDNQKENRNVLENKRKLIKANDKSREKEANKSIHNETQFFQSISAKSNKNSLYKKKLSSSKASNNPVCCFKHQISNKNKSTKEMKTKMNMKPISLNIKIKLNESDIQSSRNKTDNLNKSNTLHDSSLKEMDKFLKHQSMRFIQIMNKMVIHNRKRMKKESMNLIHCFSIKTKKKMIIPKLVVTINNKLRKLCLKNILNKLTQKILPQYIIEHNTNCKSSKKQVKQTKNNRECSKLKLNSVKKEANNDSYKSSGRLNTNEQIKPEINIISVDDLSDDKDNELEHCDFKTYQQSLKKIKELTQETKYLENNMKLFANRINNKSLPD